MPPDKQGSLSAIGAHLKGGDPTGTYGLSVLGVEPELRLYRRRLSSFEDVARVETMSVDHRAEHLEVIDGPVFAPRGSIQSEGQRWFNDGHAQSGDGAHGKVCREAERDAPPARPIMKVSIDVGSLGLGHLKERDIGRPDVAKQASKQNGTPL